MFRLPESKLVQRRLNSEASRSALDMLTLAFMLHRRLDKADVRQTAP